MYCIVKNVPWTNASQQFKVTRLVLENVTILCTGKKNPNWKMTKTCLIALSEMEQNGTDEHCTGTALPGEKTDSPSYDVVNKKDLN